MRPVSQLLTAALLACAWTTSASADPISITFEQPPCAALNAGNYPGDCYLGLGVLLSSTINFDRRVQQSFSIASDTHAVSAPNVARASAGLTDVRGDFLLAGGVSGFTNFVSWNVTGSIRGQDPWEAFVFGRNGLLLASIPGFSDQLVSFSRPQQDISRFFMAMGTAAQGMDNLSFNAPQSPSPTPEPATLLLLGSGLAVFVRRRFARS
jgi:hypothetical protein